ncbi:putative secondary metabolism biosynthetic enzyme [Purpureocillium takamizusanense]|uniref:Secondary metabolism biosynthetic enzyme n=1 Tax=Purpureocillium takamizusanense TaxID=2060973 RepID=A0A9Q8V7W4_9HYPO|nr:putative secondary metabolism biosynthetic enzyme [Purpureocillium takamizusanense]UNI16128.1 putative secondary metabolism biosynthetic enzyme [Purpureocillium takamizusanense]
MFGGDKNPIQVQAQPPGLEASPPPPLVLIHDGGGTTFSYFMLGKLNRAVWAIENPEYSSGKAWAGGVDEMAHRYIDVIIEAGIRGAIILGGWSFAGYVSLTMAHILARDPRGDLLHVAGFLMIDVPYFTPRPQLTVSTSEPEIEGIPDLVRTAFENVDDMMERWEKPRWDGPAAAVVGRGEGKLQVAGQVLAMPPPEGILHRPLGGTSWTTSHRQNGQPPTLEVTNPIIPPPGVMIRCAQPLPVTKQCPSTPARLDVHRDDVSLGWDGNYTDFLQAVIDVDADHYNVFDMCDVEKMENLTAQLITGLEILDGLDVFSLSSDDANHSSAPSHASPGSMPAHL